MGSLDLELTPTLRLPHSISLLLWMEYRNCDIAGIEKEVQIRRMVRDITQLLWRKKCPTGLGEDVDRKDYRTIAIVSAGNE